MSTPRAEVLGRRARRPRWRHAAAVLLAILALGLPAVRVDAMPRTQPGPVPAAPAASQAPAVATPVGHGPAAAAVTALTTAPAGRDPLAAVPGDFPAVMGYVPVPARMADGTVRLAKPTGACSAPGGDTPFGFGQVCKVHDYGYDLLRYAHAGGQRPTADARRQLDAMFDRDLHARCQARSRGLARLGCHLLAEGFTAVVSVNSWRQHYGNPARESLPGWSLGLAISIVAAPLLPRLVRRRGTSTRRAGGRLRALADATPAGRDRYVDFLRVVSIVTVVLGHWTIAAVARSGDGLAVGNVLSTSPGLWLATWVLQVMPVFFLVGGFSNMVSWQALERRGGGYVEYLSGRMARLLRPALVFAAVWLMIPPVLRRLGLPGEQVQLVGKIMGQPLWFLGVYVVMVALAPAMVRLHRRFRLWVPTALAAAAAAVDAVRLAAGIHQVGYLNLLLVWVLVQQLGFFYADGTLERLSCRALAGLATAGLVGLLVLAGNRPVPAEHGRPARRPLVEQAPGIPSGDVWWIAVTRTTATLPTPTREGHAHFGSNHPVRVMTAHLRFRNSPTHPDGLGDAAIQGVSSHEGVPAARLTLDPADGGTVDFSAKLDELQRRAAEAKAAAQAAASESREQLRQRIDQAKADVDLAAKDAQQDARTAAASAKSKWAEMKADAAAKMDDLQARIDKRAAHIDAEAAASDAAWAEDDAAAAIDYAAWTVDNARLAVLDAIDARSYADDLARSAGA